MDPPPRGTVVLVDDSLVSQMMMQKVLQRAGVAEQDIAVLDSGESAVREVS